MLGPLSSHTAGRRQASLGTPVPRTPTKKNAPFVWGPSQDTAFNELKNLLTHAPVLALPNFDKPFEIHCDASGNGIGGVLTQEKRPIAYFSEKLSGAQLNYPSMTKSYML